MNQEDLPLFPLDHNLLPGARKRVQVALKLDELMRSSSKKSAEKTWEQQMAEAAGIILSDAEEEEEEPLDASRSDRAASAQALQQVPMKCLSSSPQAHRIDKKPQTPYLKTLPRRPKSPHA